MIEVRGLAKRFGDFRAVDDVSFHVREGTLTALLGPSGSGKSTILRLIAGLEWPDAGEILIGGRRVNDDPPQRRGTGFVFQSYALFNHMTVRDNVAFGLAIRGRRGRDADARVDELLALVQLSGYARHFPAQLSGGQRQRVALARAIAPAPKVILLDEPFGSLDAKVRQNLGVWLRRMHDEIGVTSLFVTHDQKEVLEIADSVVVINRGRVEQIGRPHEIYDAPATRFVASFVGKVNVVEGFLEGGRLRLPALGVSLDAAGQEGAAAGGGEAVALVRPEDVELSRAGEPGAAALLITEIRYRGDHYELLLEAGGAELRSVAHKEAMAREKWSVGERAAVRFAKYNVYGAGEGHEAVRERLRNLGYIE